MSILNDQTLYELSVAQTLTNDLANNLTTKGVPSTSDEGLDTLVPKVLQIESGAETTKTQYDLWQEGFGYNWDNVVANAPMTNTSRILHVYTKVEMLRMVSNFPTDAETYTYNGNVYRQITMDTDKRLAFINDDYITNTSDNLQYICVLFGGTNLGTVVYFTNLPVVYSNSKSYRQTTFDDVYANLLWQPYTTVLLIRGIDCYRIGVVIMPPTLEHLTYQTLRQVVPVQGIVGTDTQVRLLKNIIDTKPQGVQIIFAGYQNYNIQISDEKLADLFYNDWIYNNPNVTYYRLSATNNVVRTFKLNPNNQLKTAGYYYLNGLPNAVYLTGTVTEDQTSTATDGRHGFNNSGWTLLKNFPMWTVLEGASTGCLLPAQTAHPSANFRFYSMNLERSNFALFNDGVIDTDPTKSFVANLPTVLAGSAQTILFDDTTFKNQFTEDEQTQIVSTITGKNWGLTW